MTQDFYLDVKASSVVYGDQTIQVLDLKTIDYEKSLLYQDGLVKQVIEDKTNQFLVFCKHPPVVTLGRGVKKNEKGDIPDIEGWKGDVSFTSRGGRATYHGPEQLVIYPIFKLKSGKLIAYLRGLEDVLIEVFQDLGLTCQSEPSFMKRKPDDLNVTGVWHQDKKVASLGIAMRQNVVFHGLALHVYQADIQGLKPCGFESQIFSSLEEEGLKISSFEDLKNRFLSKFLLFLPQVTDSR